MDALFEGATRQIEDTTNLAFKNEIEVLKNRENIQIHSTEISCLKTNLELQRISLKDWKDWSNTRRLTWDFKRSGENWTI